MGIFDIRISQLRRKAIPAIGLFEPIHFEDSEKLADFFYRLFDTSLAYEIAQNPNGRASQAAAFTPIGEGRHFFAGRYKPKGQVGSLCIALPKPAFFGRDQQNATRKWLSLTEKLRNVSTPMVPPIESLLDAKTGLLKAIVTPYGEMADDSNVGEHWRPLVEYIKATVDDLYRVGLEIDDYIQIKRLGETPFICDFSDLTLRNI